MLPDNKAELILASVYECIYFFHQCFYVKGKEIIKLPFFQLGLKMENTVTFLKEKNKLEILIKKGSLIKSYLTDYITKYVGAKSFKITKLKSPNNSFSKFSVDFDACSSSDLFLLEKNFGFKGSYYSIPFSLIDLTLGSFGDCRPKLYQMYNIVCWRVMKAKDKEDLEKNWVKKIDKNSGTSSTVSILKDQKDISRCCKVDNGLCEYQKMIKNKKTNFFSSELNILFFDHCGLETQIQNNKQALESIQSESEESYSAETYDSEHSVEKEIITFKNDKNKNNDFSIRRIVNKFMDCRPHFVRNRALKNTQDTEKKQIQEKNKPEIKTTKKVSKEPKNKKNRNIEIVKKRLGEEIDFKDLDEEEVNKIKARLNKIKKREKQRRVNRRKKELQKEQAIIKRINF